MVNKEPFIGIMMLNTSFPRYVGDVGNEKTFSFPVHRIIVESANSKNIVLNQNMDLLEAFIETAILLEGMGAKAITTSCGFLALFQKEISSAVNIPVATSTLVLLPFISSIIGGKKVGILTANSQTLSKRHFECCGAGDIPVLVKGMEGTQFHKMYVQNQQADVSVMQEELYDRAIDIVKSDVVGALLLECTNMPPFAGKLYQLGVPIFDIRTLVNFLYMSIS